MQKHSLRFNDIVMELPLYITQLCEPLLVVMLCKTFLEPCIWL